jgi:glycerol-3-phosphate acyltransferase PlsY
MTEFVYWSSASLRPAAVIIIAYLLGSIPFGYLIVHATQGADVRETGSGGTGATNVSRRAGRAAGAITLVLDALKGATAVIFAELILGLPILTAGGHAGSPLLSRGPTEAQWWVAGAAIAAIVGHIFPIWLRFRGGKGVATGVGVLLMLAPIAVVFAALVFLLVVALTRYVSLGSIVAAVAIPFFVLLQNAFIQPTESLAPIMTVAIVGAALIVFAHRDNVRRLLQGSESKFR